MSYWETQKKPSDIETDRCIFREASYNDDQSFDSDLYKTLEYAKENA